ncbi:hypothetical protein XBI1_3010011 [Xenorhabdus bovienii str. Intermedium]|uniref:Uncharacterized protein n=1 Tax=Xenorhabdus bovienii str. Intermedium TaxID=1379677 RepID=A0A077QDU8_XENBV|nr:hypothetical protein XBI1_3010011 [Xenorhabdus bovienii str. Intermedium]
MTNFISLMRQNRLHACLGIIIRKYIPDSFIILTLTLMLY